MRRIVITIIVLFLVAFLGIIGYQFYKNYSENKPAQEFIAKFKEINPEKALQETTKQEIILTGTLKRPVSRTGAQACGRD